MALYAQDAMETERPWERWEYRYSENEKWIPIIEHPQWGNGSCHPEWNDYTEYRRKPTTININEHEVPEPVRTPLEKGTMYYIPIIHWAAKYDEYMWDEDYIDEYFLKRGLIHLSEEAASKHAEALLSFTSED